ncbi:MAG: hypothetical protein U5N86_04610 [Planctomycetota bacterium]|nr:hypothetical protein [Planctomycetota bacterium]
MSDTRMMRGTLVKFADGESLRIATIPFTDEGFAIARSLDELAKVEGGNAKRMKALLDVCFEAVRLNYPHISRKELSQKLDLESAYAVIAALKARNA